MADDSSAYIYILCVCVRVCSEDTLKPWGRCVLQFVYIHTVHIHTYIHTYVHVFVYACILCVCVRIGDVAYVRSALVGQVCGQLLRQHPANGA